MNISPEEAAASLRDIEASRRAMQRAVRDHRGHLYLWIWGGFWAVISVLEALDVRNLVRITNGLLLAGVVVTVISILLQRRQVRKTRDKRFLAVCAVLFAFGYVVWPIFLGGPQSFASGFGFSLLVWMQIYIVAGIWFQNFWVWIGLAMTLLIVAAFLLFPAHFWIAPLVGGATLIATGFHLRNAQCT